MIALVLLLPDRPENPRWALLAIPLLVAGVGSGGVVSPNFTLALAEVPPRMGGAAGAALQTGQRIGCAGLLAGATGLWRSRWLCGGPAAR